MTHLGMASRFARMLLVASLTALLSGCAQFPYFRKEPKDPTHFVKLYPGPTLPLARVAVLEGWATEYEISVPKTFLGTKHIAARFLRVDGVSMSLEEGAFICLLPGRHTLTERIDATNDRREMGNPVNRKEMSATKRITVNLKAGRLYRHSWTATYIGGDKWRWDMSFRKPQPTPESWYNYYARRAIQREHKRKARK